MKYARKYNYLQSIINIISTIAFSKICIALTIRNEYKAGIINLISSLIIHMLKKLFNRNFTLLILGSSVLGMVLPVIIVVGSLAGIQLSPYKELATLPVSIGLLGGPIAAIPISLLMGKYGRKAGFLTGAFFALTGGTLGALSLIQVNFIMLNLAHLCFGVSIVSFNFFRFAAAEVVEKKLQPTAISFVMGTSLFAAIASPQLFLFTHDLFAPITLAGTYAFIIPIVIIGAIPVALLRIKTPQPYNNQLKNTPLKNKSGDVFTVLKRPQVATAIICAASVFAVMTYLMTPAPIAIINHGFSYLQAGNVVGWHIIAMFAPSFLTGFIITKYGSIPIIFFGLFLLVLSPIVALFDTQLIHFYLSMLLLGIAWNFAFIGSTTLLNDSLSAEEKPMIQGINDTMVSLASAIASFSSGLIIAKTSWNTVLFITFPFISLSCLALIIFVIHRNKHQKVY